jgi:competence protein ComEA
VSRFINGWTLTIAFLLVVIIAGGLAALSRYDRSPPLEIYITPEPELVGEVYIGGEVVNPGVYPIKAGDTLDNIIRAAGGTGANADLNRLDLHVPAMTENREYQKVNINLAEAWLLAALPGIGETRARAIVDYRENSGPFRHTHEIMNVANIGPAIYEEIKHLITVAE